MGVSLFQVENIPFQSGAFMNKFACTLSGGSIGAVVGAWAALHISLLLILCIALAVLVLVVCCSPVGHKLLPRKKTTKKLPPVKTATRGRKKVAKA